MDIPVFVKNGSKDEIVHFNDEQDLLLDKLELNVEKNKICASSNKPWPFYEENLLFFFVLSYFCNFPLVRKKDDATTHSLLKTFRGWSLS